MNTGIWRGMPLLTKEGQMAFWDAQADVYEVADMTNDNRGELDIVLEKSREINCRDIVTLGGAVGCRDPKVILEDMLARNIGSMPKVIFNDLSAPQTRKAGELLKPVADQGVSIAYMPGEIKDVCANIDGAPRRLILGVYHCDAFFEADVGAGYPNPGYEDYLKNYAILGEQFFVSWVSLTQTHEVAPVGICAHVQYDDSAGKQRAIKNIMASSRREMANCGVDLSALQVVGIHEGREGFFLSHWYTSEGILELTRRVFSPDRFTITESRCAKGTVLVIDPIGIELTGIVTILNNVVGNILPQSQYETLVAVREMMS